MERLFHHLYSDTMHPLDLTDEEYELATRTWLCPGCKQPKPGVREVDVRIENRNIDVSPLNGVMGCWIPVARRDFLFSFGEDLVKRDLFLGRVFGPDQKQMEELVTFRGKCSLIVRGHKHVSHRVCDECGRQVYFAMIGGRYLFPEPPTDIAIFESDLLGLIVPDDLFRRVDLRRWRKITHEELPVAEWPLDGLQDLKAIEDRRVGT